MSYSPKATTTSSAVGSNEAELLRKKVTAFEALVQDDAELKHCVQCLSLDLRISILNEYRLATVDELLNRVRSSDCIQVGGRWFVPK